SILLDQFAGSLEGSLRKVLDCLEGKDIQQACRLLQGLHAQARIGRHLTQPFRVAVAGAPNVGKSSLVNALAGYSRTIISPTPGTTRDLLTVPIALDGWPVELIDTAGLRAAVEPLEQQGIERADRALQ